VNRGEAQTVLFPPPSAAKTVPLPPAKTGAAPTQTVAGQNTVKAGDTTVVRPVNAGPGRRMLPVALSAVALLILACGAFAFVVWRKNHRDDDVMRVNGVTTPAPAASPAIAEPTAPPSTAETPARPEEQAATTSKPAATPKKQDRASGEDDDRSDDEQRKAREDAQKARDEERKAREEERKRREEEPRVRVEVDTHDEDPPDVPTPPNGVTPNRPRRPQTKVLPGGVVMKVLPDGSQIITMRDGTRVYVAPDGRRTVVPPRDRPNRRTPAPSPSP
jgi:hypothetical protein